MAASVFLSYASDDRQAARTLGDALTSFGLEVWLDESALGGGDAWDQKIRRQIRECDYFMPVVSARTEARHEGYFRREWRLAVERTLDMADDHLFLLPVVIDGTDETRARVPEKFLAVQWLRLPDGQPTPALEALCRRILSGGVPEPQVARKPAAPPVAAPSPSRAVAIPPFPREEPGQRVRFWAQVLGWVFHAGWLYFQRLPGWIRWILYAWGVGILFSHGCTPSHHKSAEPSAAELSKLKAITDQYQGSVDPADIAKLGAKIAREFSDEASDGPAPNPVLAIPFAAPAGDPAAAKLADTAFAQTYGRLAMSHHGHIDHQSRLRTFEGREGCAGPGTCESCELRGLWCGGNAGRRDGLDGDRSRRGRHGRLDSVLSHRDGGPVENRRGRGFQRSGPRQRLTRRAFDPEPDLGRRSPISSAGTPCE